jgi:replicative DNA helicase
MKQEPQLLPFSEDVEKGLLCSAIKSRVVLSYCSASLAPEMFHLPAHRIIFRTLCALTDEEVRIDFVAVKSALKNAGSLQEIGGQEYLNSLWDFVPSADNWEHYSKLLLEYYDRRVGITECLGLSEKLRDLRTETNPRQLIIETLGRIGAKLEARIVERRKSFSLLVDETLEQIEQRAGEQHAASGIRFGMEKLDEELDGVQPGELCVISGQTSSGKSALALQAILWAARQRRGTALFSLEMPGTQSVERMFAADGEISMKVIRAGLFSEAEHKRLLASVLRIRSYPIHVEEQSAGNITGIIDQCRMLKTEENISLVVVDYLQLVQPGRLRREDTREREVADVSRRLKALATELKVSVFALSQVNDQGLLRESRAIGQDADIVLKIEESKSEDASDVDIVVEKHRSGARGKRITVQFYGQYIRFH